MKYLRIIWVYPLMVAFYLSVCLLAGCATLNSAGEATWQAAHAVDVAQTIHGAVDDNTCYEEGDPITRRIIGTHPNEAGTLGWGAGLAGLHYGVHRLLEDYAPVWADTLWQAVTIAQVGEIVDHNVRVGIRLGARNEHPSICNGRTTVRSPEDH
jgi:hypothetical protein